MFRKALFAFEPSLKGSRNNYYMGFPLEESYSFQLVNTDPIRGIGDTQRHFGCHD